MTQNTPSCAESVIAKQVETYNTRDLEGYMALFAEDVQIFDHPGVLTLNGKDAVYKRYEEIFRDRPLNETKILHRIVLGGRVIDHEIVYRDGTEKPGFEVLAIYEVAGGLIKRIDFVRATS